MPEKILRLLLFTVSATAILYFLYRDAETESVYTFDFRNRQVGSRIQKDGGMPYFYVWKPGDKERYYDLQPSEKYSNITATPFFHQLLYPVADLTHRKASLIWFIAEYLMYFLCIGIAWSFAGKNNQKLAVLLVGFGFPFTLAWKLHIAAGQYYLLIPFLLLVFLYFLNRPPSVFYFFLAGLTAITVFLIRPNTIIFFLPFLLLARQYSPKHLFAFALPVVLILILSFGSSHHRALWMNYKNGMEMQLYAHRHPEAGKGGADTISRFATADGWNLKKITDDQMVRKMRSLSENGNFFVVFEKFTGIRLEASTLTVILLLVLGLSTTLFFIKYKTAALLSPHYLAIFGFCLYMISDLLSPVYRHQYYTVQWLGPLLLAAAVYNGKFKLYYTIAAVGLLLNIVNSPFIKMEHTIGEYLLLISLLLISFTSFNKTKG